MSDIRPSINTNFMIDNTVTESDHVVQHIEQNELIIENPQERQTLTHQREQNFLHFKNLCIPDETLADNLAQDGTLPIDTHSTVATIVSNTLMVPTFNNDGKKQTNKWNNIPKMLFICTIHDKYKQNTTTITNRTNITSK